MPFSATTVDRERDKFRQTPGGDTAVAVIQDPDSTTSVSSEPLSVGVNTRPNVTVASSIVLAANANRKYASFFNQSGAVMYFRYGAAAAVNQGIRVPNNTLLEINASGLWVGDVHAIVNAGTQPLEVFEATV